MAKMQSYIFVNNATSSALQQLAGITPANVEALIAGRPYHSWEEVQLSGIGLDGVKALQSQGVELGEPSSGPIGEAGSGGSGGSPAGNLGRA